MVLTDLAPEMLDVAERRAVVQGIINVKTKVCSADDLTQPQYRDVNGLCTVAL